MIESLIQHSFDRPTIHVLAMDAACSASLKQVNLPGVLVYEMADFEAMTGMRETRKTRTHREYCWTCGSVFTNFVAPQCSGNVCYLDADLFWFFDPGMIFHEIGDRAIGITPHRFAKKDEPRLLPNGKFNVQIVAFQGPVGMAALRKWAAQCQDWCFATHDAGRFGDQGYLDSWPKDYPDEVCEISNPGVGLAPWNIANYAIASDGDSVMVDTFRLVVYHAHEFTQLDNGLFRYTGWPLRDSDKKFIYEPYVAKTRQWKSRLESMAA